MLGLEVYMQEKPHGYQPARKPPGFIRLARTWPPRNHEYDGAPIGAATLDGVVEQAVTDAMALERAYPRSWCRTTSQAPEASGDASFFGGADAVVTSRPAAEEAIALADTIRSRIEAPILIGGHAGHESISQLLEHADGAIVGGAFEKDARQAGVDASLVRDFMRRAGFS